MHIKYNRSDISEKYERFGIKIYKFCDSRLYLWHECLLRRAHQDDTVSYAMIRDLCKRVNEVGHKLYIDNFFSSQNLFDDEENKYLQDKT